MKRHENCADRAAHGERAAAALWRDRANCFLSHRWGRKLRCRASTFLASTIVRQRPGLCKARLSWRSLEGYCACRRHQRCHWRKRGLRYVADFWAALGQATACSYVSMWGAERKAQWRIEEWRAQIDPMQVQILLPKRISRRSQSMQREGIFRDMKLRGHHEKPSKRNRGRRRKLSTAPASSRARKCSARACCR